MNGQKTGKNRKRVLLVLQYYDYRHHSGVARYAAQAGWALEDAYTMLRSLPEQWEGDGVISFHGPSQEFVDWLNAVRAPVVDMGEDQGISKFPRVMTDNQKIASLAVEHFVARGFKDVGLVWARETAVTQRRREALEIAARAAGLHFWDVPLTRIPRLTLERAFPLGLMAVTDGTAVRALRACEDAGILVPEQAAILGVDNFTYRCAPASVPLSSIDPDQERVGYEAAVMLDRLMRGEPIEWPSVRVPPLGIVQRDSTDIIAVADVEVAKALRFIVKHVREEISLSDVAAATSLSLRRLQTRFKDVLGQTILHEINRRRVVIARAMLRDTSKKIRVVAAECGFGSAIKLIRVFKQYEGTSPRRFRKELDAC